MTAPTAEDNPYLGLSSYGEVDKDAFHGRHQETAELLQLVKRQTLTVVYGLSGLGKSSLLRAGLFPALREAHHLPIVVRLAFGGGAGDLMTQVKAILAQEIVEREIDASPPAGEQTLWDYFHRTSFWDLRNRPLVPVLVFDQFEELFTIGSTAPSRDAFLTQLADLIENRVPLDVVQRADPDALPAKYNQAKAKVIISLREDFLSHLDDLRKARQIAAFGQERFRLHPLNGVNAMQAVYNTRTERVVTVAVAEEIVRFVAGPRPDRQAREPALAELTIEPFLLSLVCRQLDERRRARGEPTISTDLLSGESKQILSDFYADVVGDLPPRAHEYLEDHLLTESGFRATVARADAERAMASGKETGKEIDVLVNRRLLRIEDRLGQPHVEIIHDILTAVLRERRDDRREAAARASEEAARAVAAAAKAREEAAKKRSTRQKRVVAAVILALLTAAVGVILYGAGVKTQQHLLEQQQQTIELQQHELASQQTELVTKQHDLETNVINVALSDADNLTGLWHLRSLSYESDRKAADLDAKLNQVKQELALAEAAKQAALAAQKNAEAQLDILQKRYGRH